MAGLGPVASSSSSVPLRTGCSPEPDAADQRRNWDAAYASLANKSEFSETEFVRDLTGSYASLRSYADAGKL